MPKVNTPIMNRSPMHPPYFLPIGGGHKVTVDPQTNHIAKGDTNCQCFDMVLIYHFCLVISDQFAYTLSIMFPISNAKNHFFSEW